MKLLQHLIAVMGLGAILVATAAELPAAKDAAAAVQPIATELQPLQGTWEGVMVGDDARQKITITITRDALHFHRDADFWFETIIVLPAGKEPGQLHATIKGCPPSQGASIGQVVRALFKIKDGTLTLATIGDDAEETAQSFETAGARYELRKAPSPKQDVEPPKAG